MKLKFRKTDSTDLYQQLLILDERSEAAARAGDEQTLIEIENARAAMTKAARVRLGMTV